MARATVALTASRPRYTQGDGLEAVRKGDQGHGRCGRDLFPVSRAQAEQSGSRFATCHPGPEGPGWRGSLDAACSCAGRLDTN